MARKSTEHSSLFVRIQNSEKDNHTSLSKPDSYEVPVEHISYIIKKFLKIVLGSTFGFSLIMIHDNLNGL